MPGRSFERQFGVPAGPVQSPEDFESLCLDLFREIWEDPNAQKEGRSGQKQKGVDVVGRHDGRLVGVQCKRNDALQGKRLTVGVLQEEVDLAKEFEPRLTSFILAATSPRDATLQEEARKLSLEAGFEVSVWSWDDIAEALFHRIELLRTIFPKYWPTFDRLEKLPPQRVSVTRLPRSADRLFGREARLAQLAAAWTEKKIRVLTLVAWGGVGKTSLVAKFADTLASRNFDGADYFDWSFYSQVRAMPATLRRTPLWMRPCAFLATSPRPTVVFPPGIKVPSWRSCWPPGELCWCSMVSNRCNIRPVR